MRLTRLYWRGHSQSDENVRVKENLKNGGLEDKIYLTTFLGGPRPGGVGVPPWVCPVPCPCSPGGLWGMSGPTGVTWV
jgi:hypothetical protein